MKFVVDLLKLIAVILPLVGKMLESNYKKRNVNEKDITEEDNELFTEKETSNNPNNNDTIENNSNIPHTEI
jgi:hypothetical protein|uniref:Uncharacterized protein n=1 Tax=Microviridae sp. ctRQq14 TaxID=2826735 RepID=A0A8S5N6J9_9VIRU|nr:MAG TPA: hypothetical protein [Microviridae sp. ctRQq14]